MPSSAIPAASELDLLRDRFKGLAERLREAADGLEGPGMPPSEELLAALSKARKAFLDLAATVPLNVDPLTCLEEIEAWSNEARQNEVYPRALESLERVRALEHIERTDYQPLLDLHAQTKPLIDALRDRTIPEEQIDTLLRPFTLLLELIDEDDDERQAELFDDLCDLNGVVQRSLAVSAMKGKLHVRTNRLALAPSDLTLNPSARPSDLPVQEDAWELDSDVYEIASDSEAETAQPKIDIEEPLQDPKSSRAVRRASLAGSIRLSDLASSRGIRRRQPKRRSESRVVSERLDPAHAILIPPYSKSAVGQLPPVIPAEEKPVVPPTGERADGADSDPLEDSETLRGRSDMPPGQLAKADHIAEADSRAEVELIQSSNLGPSLRGPGFSPDLMSLDDFRRVHALDVAGQVIPAPWLKPEFAVALRNTADAALNQGRYAELWLMARAAEITEINGLPTSAEVDALIEMVRAPENAGMGTQSDRSSYLLREISNGRANEGALKLAVVLEALRPSSNSRIPGAESEQVVLKAGFSHGPVADFLATALRFGSEGGSPLDTLRQFALKKVNKPGAQVPIDIEAVKEEFRSDIKRFWHSAGGRLLTNHCKDAWSEFMGVAQPTFDAILAGNEPSERMLPALEGLAKDAKVLFDRRNAHLDDRRKMDRTVKSLLEGARKVVITQRQAQHATKNTENTRNALLKAFEALDARNSTASSTDWWVISLLGMLLPGAQSQLPIGAISSSMLLACPPLLTAVPLVVLSSEVTDDALIEVEHVAYPLEATALMLQSAEAPQPASLDALLGHLTEKFPELLVHFVGLKGGVAQRALETNEEVQIALHKQLERLISARNGLLHLGSPFSNDLRRILDQARKAVDQAPPFESPSALARVWLTRVADQAEAIRNQEAQALVSEAKRVSSERGAVVAEAVARGRYAEALALAKGEATPPSDSLRSLPWRDEAAARWPHPYRVLRDYHGDAEELVSLWLKGMGSERPYDDLRSAFAQFFLSSNRAKSDIKIRATDIGISCKVLRDWISRDRLNPSFVPQLAHFEQLVIATPRLGPEADNFVQDTASMVAKGTARLILLLVPGLSDGVRRAFLNEARRRDLIGVALIDELDLCRLLNPGEQLPNPLLGMLEILFEQAQKWAPLSPFESMDGQHTKPEVYVGRRNEARDLATTAKFSRLFSGRRLGKSALLKSVVDTYDGEELPSKNKLRVLYVPAVGVEHEQGIVDAIAAAMSDRLGYRKAVHGEPGKRLETLIHGYLDENRKDSLLIFLDEADQFVESENAGYEKHRESSLTWLMRSKLEALTDAHDLPRVRFVFSGYRATHRSEGAWANWGDVLRLSPLEPEDAIKLITGPLERMGIRVGPLAADIARRCGYQPAVLLRFGRQLLEHLDKIAPSRREGIAVGDDDVALVFASDQVQQEIRTVVSNNFQGNRLGKIVFAALLLAFRGLAPGATLEDAPTHVSRILAEVAPDFQGFAPSAGSSYDQIAYLMRDFARRSLLEVVDPMRHFYRMRFPHHLQVLLHEDQTTVIRSEIRALGDGPIRDFPIVHSMIGTTALDELRYVLSPESGNLGVVATVACSHWFEPITDPRALVYRLGFNDNDVVKVSDRFTAREVADRSRLVISGAGTEQVKAVLSRRDRQSTPPLFLGGADLLRWGLRHSRRNNEIVVVASVGRLDLPHLHWWFERVRGLEFMGSSPIRRFHELTSGIPVLVGWLEQSLGRWVVDSATVTEPEVETAIKDYLRDLPTNARMLLSSEHRGVKLLAREVELLHMVSLASQKLGGDDLLSVLSNWEEFAELLGSPPYTSLVPGQEKDEEALQVLVGFGLLRRNPLSSSTVASEYVDALPPDDTIHELVALLRS